MKERIKRMLALLLIAATAVGCFGCGRVSVVIDGNGNATAPEREESTVVPDDTEALEENNTEAEYSENDGQADYNSGAEEASTFDEPEITMLSAPYNALAVDYDGCFYYIDAQGNICRTTIDMTDYELYYPAPFGGDTRIIGITNAGRMYISNGASSCYIDISGGSSGPAGERRAVETLSFTGEPRPVAIVGMWDRFMYYTKADEPGLFRANIAAQPQDEEKILNTEIRSAAVVSDYLVYVYKEGNRMYLEAVDVEETSVHLFSAESTSDEPVLNIVAADDRSGQAMLAYETHDSVGWLMSGITLYACNLDNSHIAEPVVMDSGTARNLSYCFDETGRYLLFFENCLRLKKLGSLSGTTDLYRADAYYTDEDFWSFFAMTCAGNDWYFFADSVQCGAQYAIQEGGTDIVRLQ